MKLGSLPRIRLASLPTSIQELPNLLKKLDLDIVLVKNRAAGHLGDKGRGW